MRFFIVISFFLLFYSCGTKYPTLTPPSIKQGEIDLKNWDFEKNGPLDLDGEWIFYWKRFIPVKDVLENNLPEKPLLIKASGLLWDEQLNLPRKGHGTIIVRIKNLQKKNKLRINFNQIATSHETYLTDGCLFLFLRARYKS